MNGKQSPLSTFERSPSLGDAASSSARSVRHDTELRHANRISWQSEGMRATERHLAGRLARALPLFITSVFVTFSGLTHAQPIPESVVQLSRFQTCRTCSAFQLRFYSDGSSYLHGQDGVRFLGETGTVFFRSWWPGRSKYIQPTDEPNTQMQARIDATVAQLNLLGFFRLDNEYLRAGAADGTMEISINIPGSVKTVRFQDSVAPSELLEAAERIRSLYDRRATIETAPFFGDRDAVLLLEETLAAPCGFDRVLIVYRNGNALLVGANDHLAKSASDYQRIQGTLDPGAVAALLASFSEAKFASPETARVVRPGFTSRLLIKSDDNVFGVVFDDQPVTIKTAMNDAFGWSRRLGDRLEAVTPERKVACARIPHK